jgi:class 3 adenylate cyclase
MQPPSEETPMPDHRPDEATDLPDLTAIMVVDAEKFSRHDDRQQDELARLIPEVLEDACHRCGLEELWEQRMFPDSTGDGYLIGFPPGFLPRLIDRYFDSLQQVLAEKADRLRSRQMRLRMRLSVHLGPARVLDGVDSPVGTAMITTHRLVDAGPLRVLLDRSDPDVTLLAVALSERVMTDVVTGGHTRRLRSSQFVECPLEIAGKGFKATAFLHVPAVSGELLRTGLIGALPHEPIEVPPVAGEGTKRPRPGVVAGRDVDQSRHTTTVHGDQYRAGRNMSIRREAR